MSTNATTGIFSLFASARAKCSLFRSTTKSAPGFFCISDIPFRFFSNL